MRTGPESFRSRLDRDLDEQSGAAVGRAGHLERAADRLDALAEPGQPGSLGRVGSADPVVADRQLSRSTVNLEPDGRQRLRRSPRPPADPGNARSTWRGHSLASPLDARSTRPPRVLFRQMLAARTSAVAVLIVKTSHGERSAGFVKNDFEETHAMKTSLYGGTAFLYYALIAPQRIGLCP
jgi:hypothetical protein